MSSHPLDFSNMLRNYGNIIPVIFFAYQKGLVISHYTLTVLYSFLGESLSKKELEANNRIKKLRIKLKEVTGEKDSHR